MPAGGAHVPVEMEADQGQPVKPGPPHDKTLWGITENEPDPDGSCPGEGGRGVQPCLGSAGGAVGHCPGRRPHQLWEAESPEACVPQTTSQGGPLTRLRAGGRSQAAGRATWAERATGPVPPTPLHGGHWSQIQLLTQCVIITANSPLKRNYHQYDISRQRGNEERKVLILPLSP